MNRTYLQFLNEWISKENRQALVIRGARQVGKTWLVRYFAKQTNKRLIELNLEKQPQLASLFSSNDPKQTLNNISARFNEHIDPKQNIVFLDEIQNTPDLLGKLRWFTEELPELPIIAAGSLLEFVLGDHTFSMPVGRISYMHLEPLSFEEYLEAKEYTQLSQYLSNYSFNQEIPIAIHEQLIALFKEYIIIGGMPSAVSSWINNHSLQEVNQIQHDLLATYRDDFAKYSGRLSTGRLEEVMLATPKLLGNKFIMRNVNPEIHSKNIKRAIQLLNKARICHTVKSTAANGLPLGAEIKEKHFKEIFIDTGLCSIALGLSLDQINSINEITLINKSGMAEQAVGQLLRTLLPPYIEPQLYYWHRDEKGSNAEIDYVIQHGNQIIPIEVKAGSTGSLKSLHLFMGIKNLSKAIRVNSDLPTKTAVKVKDHLGQNIEYTLLSIPFYLIPQIHRLLDE